MRAALLDGGIAPEQVHIEVMIAEVTLSGDTEFGVEWSLLSDGRIGGYDGQEKIGVNNNGAVPLFPPDIDNPLRSGFGYLFYTIPAVAVGADSAVVGLDGVLTALQVDTRDGAVEVTARPGSRTDGDWEVVSGDGDVRVEVPDGFGADVDARTGDGRVRIDSITRPRGEKADDHDDRESVIGKLGGGGRPLRLRTSSGSITVKPSNAVPSCTSKVAMPPRS